MIEFLVGFGILLLIAWFVWGVIVFVTEWDEWYPFKELYRYEQFALVGAGLGVVYLAVWLSWVIGSIVLS